MVPNRVSVRITAVISCPICKSTTIEVRRPLRGYREYVLHACRDCAVEFVHPQPSDEDLAALYSESYYHAWGLQDPQMGETVRAMKVATFGLRLDRIREFVPRGTILDVGCATGFFLEAAEAAGFSPHGVELSPYSARLAQERFGTDRIFNGTLEEAPFPPGSFDVIAMSDLLEHVRDPLAVLRTAAGLLKDNGILMVMTPTTDSLTRRVMGARWAQYKLEHLFYFNPRSLDHIADMTGFKIVHCEPALKYLNLAYFYFQSTIYPHRVFTPLLRLLHAALPEGALRKNFRVTIGELVAILKKTAAKDQRSP